MAAKLANTSTILPLFVEQLRVVVVSRSHTLSKQEIESVYRCSSVGCVKAGRYGNIDVFGSNSLHYITSLLGAVASALQRTENLKKNSLFTELIAFPSFFFLLCVSTKGEYPSILGESI